MGARDRSGRRHGTGADPPEPGSPRWCNADVSLLRSTSIAAGLVAGILALAGGPAAGETASSAKGCRVTLPNGKAPPGSLRAQLPPDPPVFHGNGKLWVKLWPFGVIVAKPNVIDSDGSIGIKLPWWRGVAGTLTVTATRLDAQVRRVRGDVPSGYGRTGFQASGVVFPTQGCWQVTGRVGSVKLVFVTLVVKAAGNGY
jgi:hypothetical protein